VICEQLNVEPEREGEVKAHIEALSGDGYIMLRAGAIAVEYPYERVSQIIGKLLEKARNLQA